MCAEKIQQPLLQHNLVQRNNGFLESRSVSNWSLNALSQVESRFSVNACGGKTCHTVSRVPVLTAPEAEASLRAETWSTSSTFPTPSTKVWSRSRGQ